MLSCSCDDGDDADWYYYGQPEVAPLATKRWRKCCSCKALIRPGDDCMAFERFRHVSPYSDPEVLVRIYGEGGEMPLPTWHLCDRCAGLFESLDGLGFCNLLGQNLVKVCREYAEMQRDAGVFRGQMAVRRDPPNAPAP